MKEWLRLFLICIVSLWILATVPFPTHDAGDLLYLLHGIADLLTNGF